MTLPEYSARQRVVNPTRLRGLFGARNIAIVGASNTSSWAVNLLRSLEQGGGVKNLTFVHPKYQELFGRPTIPSLRALSSPADLAYIMVGPSRVEEILDDVAAAGISNAVVLAAGYGEAGDTGKQLQQSLARRAVELDITLMGPNTIGFVNATEGIAPWAVAVPSAAPLAGPVGAVFESGSMARATYEFAIAQGVGSSIWASVGNSAVVTSLDVMEYLIEDESTRSIALFLETVREPDRLFTLGRRALEASKPVVAFKAGRSEEGRRSAMAHTGAVATDDAVTNAAFRQAGIVRVDSIEQLVSSAGLLGYSRRLPEGRRMGVVTSSGGGCNVIADLAEANEIALPAWQPDTEAKLRDQLPDFASVLNPLDTTGFGHARARPRPTKAEDDLMELAVGDAGIDFMFTMMTPLPPVPPEDPTPIESRMTIIGQIAAASPVPVFFSSNTCLDIPEYPQSLLSDNGLYLLPGADLALHSIGHMLRWIDQRRALLGRAIASRPDGRPVSVGAPQGTWSEDEGRLLLADAGVPLVPAKLVTSSLEAAEEAAQIGAPVAMKICSRSIPHKSDIGGVVLGVQGGPAAAQTYHDILARVASQAPQADRRGVLVSPMSEPGHDLLVGITVDRTFGPLLAVGLGGVWVEVLNDTSLRVLPVGPEDVVEMIEELKGAALMKGVRGGIRTDLRKLADVVVAISAAALSLGDRLESLEVNPLRLGASRIEALDVLVVTHDGEGSAK